MCFSQWRYRLSDVRIRRLNALRSARSSRLQDSTYSRLPLSGCASHHAGDDLGGRRSVNDFAYRLKTVDIGAIILDANLMIRSISPSAAALLGVDAALLIGKPLLAMHPGDARLKFPCCFHRRARPDRRLHP